VGKRIAVDTQISDVVEMELKAYGHRVLRAAHGETDKMFFQRAERFGAELYVSPDYDWMNFSLDRGLQFLHLGQGWSMNKTLKEILKFVKGGRRK
jgi:hypothetical protein